jgi:hypothetical protein
MLFIDHDLRNTADIIADARWVNVLVSTMSALTFSFSRASRCAVITAVGGSAGNRAKENLDMDGLVNRSNPFFQLGGNCSSRRMHQNTGQE